MLTEHVAFMLIERGGRQLSPPSGHPTGTATHRRSSSRTLGPIPAMLGHPAGCAFGASFRTAAARTIGHPLRAGSGRGHDGAGQPVWHRADRQRRDRHASHLHVVTGFDDQFAAGRDLHSDVVVHDPMELAGPLICALLAGRACLSGYGLAFRPPLQAAAADGVADRWRRHGLDIPVDAGIYGQLYHDPCPPSLADRTVPVPPVGQPLRPSFRNSDFDGVPAADPAPRGPRWSTPWARCTAVWDWSRWR